MPEGDTIHRTANALRPALAGRPLRAFEAPRLPAPHPAPGTTVEGVEARGKHLLIRFGDGTILHTHLRMSGSWHLYRPGDRWQRPVRQRRVSIAVDDAVAVCFNAPVVALLDDQALARHPALRRLGPDLCEPSADLARAAANLAALPPRTLVADALLDQRVASGVGNVYKCEVCFVQGLDPRTPVGLLAPDEPAALVGTAAELLQRNLTRTFRSTVGGRRDGTVWVYGRGGRACRRCGSTIRSEMIGERPRRTQWCPVCQPPRDAVPTPG